MTEDLAKTGPFHKLHHISVVVRDVEKAMKFYESIGIGPWQDYPAREDFTTLEVHDVEGFKKIKMKIAFLNDKMQLQLIEPGDDQTAYRKFLDEKGEGVYHIGFVVDDVEAGEAEGEKRGLKVYMRGRRDDGSGFTYFDTAKKGGVTLSIRRSPEYQK
jgi:methylmalonyl-CoA/ethylmalonyl-CoA epimerase